jgi:DNA (cytosine-5)-methyltransferase 1
MKNFFAIDLFAGCGGISEGFTNAGFDVIAEVEMNKFACETLSTRHFFHELQKNKRLDLYKQYIQGLKTREDLFREFPDLQDIISHRVIQATLSDETIQTTIKRIEASKKYHNASKIHVFLGGPPCQPYSIINRARIQKNGDTLGRNYLYKHYLELMEHFKPDVFIFENVPGLFTATADGNRIFEKLMNDFLSLRPAYEIIPPLYKVSKNPHSYLLNSVNFGIPQNRKRLILIGYRKNLIRKNKLMKEIFLNLQKMGNNPNNLQITVQEAINDLPHLHPGEGNNGFYSNKYSAKRDLSPYQEKMRRDSFGVFNHFARAHMASDLERYHFFIEHYKNTGHAANLMNLIQERRDLIPEHKHLDKFVDRFKVQWWTKPASTITAHLSKDGHYFIHPDIDQCRSFTVREAARCQSFPDNFYFEGPRTEQFRQVGNAVPPLLAEVIGIAVRRELEKIYPTVNVCPNPKCKSPS